MTKYNDTPVKLMIYPALLFLVVGMTLGTFLAFNAFVFPDYFSGEYLHFGRLRPVHVFSVAWLWLLSANIGLFYYLVPRLCGVPLWSPRLAYCSIAIWWFALIIATFSYPFGTNFGWEYAELPNWVGWIPTKPLVTIAWILVVINLFATIALRRFEKLYVSLWYVMGTLIWTTFTYLAGVYFINFVPGGISRVNVNFFYMHNLVGLIFTPMGLGIAYYVLPKLTNTPIYSHRLSLIGFWSIAFVYAWVGAHHMMHGPMPQWLQTVSIIFSIWLFIPVWTVITNLFGTLKGNWEKYTESAAVRFTTMGVLFYLMTCIQGPLQALRNVNEITSKTDWIIGHSHISLFATFSFFAFSGVYLVIPAITNKPLWSDRLADWHFSLNVWGIFPFIFTLSIAGFWQGMMWSTWAEGSTYAEYHRHLAELPFLETVSRMHLSWIFRAVGGLIILLGNILFVLNMYNTILLEPSYERRAHGTL